MPADAVILPLPTAANAALLEKIAAAARALVAKKAHLASRAPAGDVDQAARGKIAETFDFSAMLRGAAG